MLARCWHWILVSGARESIHTWTPIISRQPSSYLSRDWVASRIVAKDKIICHGRIFIPHDWVTWSLRLNNVEKDSLELWFSDLKLHQNLVKRILFQVLVFLYLLLVPRVINLTWISLKTVSFLFNELLLQLQGLIVDLHGSFNGQMLWYLDIFPVILVQLKLIVLILRKPPLEVTREFFKFQTQLLEDFQSNLISSSLDLLLKNLK